MVAIANASRPHWGGAASTTDQHLEIYQGDIDTRFQYMAIFLQLSTQRSVNDRSNTYRIDRLGQGTVQGRTSGVALVTTPNKSDKLVLTVDTVLYIRNEVDYQDDWTAPDFLREIGQNNGSSFAEMFDGAHIIQLIKGRSWTAPAHLVPAFKDGIEIVADQTVSTSGNLSQAQMEANAMVINNAHRKAVEELIKRKVPMSELVTLMSVDKFGAMTEHPKLMNRDFVDGMNSYGDRRVSRMNGIPVIESTEFPGVNAVHPLGAAFNTVQADADCQVVIFSKMRTLVTIEAKPFTTRQWDDERNFCNVLDAYAMYTVGQRRPDTAAVIRFTTTTVA
ncbi:major capsid protein [Aeromonas phage vB_AspA_Lolek]|nr:major capsid protein [Aeromonas phage vB_AspA_Lolek]